MGVLGVTGAAGRPKNASKCERGAGGTQVAAKFVLLLDRGKLSGEWVSAA